MRALSHRLASATLFGGGGNVSSPVAKAVAGLISPRGLHHTSGLGGRLLPNRGRHGLHVRALRTPTMPVCPPPQTGSPWSAAHACLWAQGLRNPPKLGVHGVFMRCKSQSRQTPATMRIINVPCRRHGFRCTLPQQRHSSNSSRGGGGGGGVAAAAGSATSLSSALLSRLGSFKIVGASLRLIAVLALSLIVGWPLCDSVLFPYACRMSLYARNKIAPWEAIADADKAAGVLRLVDEQFDRRPGNLVVLTGDQASVVAKRLVQQAPCSAYIDQRRIFDSNPYELVAFRFLGISGHILNAFFKLAVFLSSVVSKRHPHVDALLFTHNINNNFMQALVDHRHSPQGHVVPYAVFDHVDTMCRMDEVLHCESKSLQSVLNYSMAEVSLSMGSDQRLAKVVWVLPDLPDTLKKPAFAAVRARSTVINVTRSRDGSQLVAKVVR
eukprot:m.59837 g.59837  ORF g.59837 m.59837 type:complete len:439 (-) comp13021_c0_seq2:67-1383(-)